MNHKFICHFSCGVTSTIATKIILDKYGSDNVEIIYANPGAEHPDNQRYLKDCEDKIFHKRVTVVTSKKYKTIFDVFRDFNYLASRNFAHCTVQMKKIPIRDYLGIKLIEDTQIFGYDNSEQKRANRYIQYNPELKVIFPLIEENISKQECIKNVMSLGVQLPIMYRMGYHNSNCIGCVKAASLSYWKKIKIDFPDIFKWYADFERQIGKKINGKPKGATINKQYRNTVRYRVFLDELDNINIRNKLEPFSIECGYSCGN